MRLEGKNAIITGASRGLGKAIATEFVKEGANVLICARGMPELFEISTYLNKLKTTYQQVHVSYADVSEQISLDKLYKTSLSKFSNIDILVNNAGIQDPIGPIDSISWNDFVKTINTNLLGTIYLCKLFIPHFKQNKSGKIINLSGGGAASSRPNFTAYATSKTGVVRFTEIIADELKDYNVQCNSISPGALNTDMLEDVLNTSPDKVGEEYQQALKQKESGGASLENAAKLCVFLATHNITGKLISAVWDDWQNLKDLNKDIYTLRRVII